MGHGDQSMKIAGPVELVGPFQHHDVVVHGWQVPYLSAEPVNGGMIHLTLDHRFGIDLTVEEADRFLPFLADCMAVALGYTCHPSPECDDPPVRRPFVRMVGLRGLPD